LKDKAKYERCLGVGKEAKPIFKRSSEEFGASSGLRSVSVRSEVQVLRTKALADKELAIARRVLESPEKRGCLAQAFDAMLGGSHTIHTSGHRVRITIANTRVAPLPVGSAAAGTSGGFGMSVSMDVTYAFTVRGRPFTVPGVFSLDSLNFIVGRASVGLTTMAFGESFPSGREASLFSLLVVRALDASGKSPTTNGPEAVARTPIATSTAQPQRPGTCRIAPPEVHFPSGDWTATATVLTTNSVDACAGEQVVRPWDFRRLCKAGACKTFLFTAGYYGVDVAKIVPDGRDRYVAIFQPSRVPCPHRPGQYTGSNQYYSTVTLWWSPDRQILHGLGRDHQVGPCGGGPSETSSYVATRTNPAANPPAQGP
jgi:hypothetical protein